MDSEGINTEKVKTYMIQESEKAMNNVARKHATGSSYDYHLPAGWLTTMLKTTMGLHKGFSYDEVEDIWFRLPYEFNVNADPSGREYGQLRYRDHRASPSASEHSAVGGYKKRRTMKRKTKKRKTNKRRTKKRKTKKRKSLKKTRRRHF